MRTARVVVGDETQRIALAIYVNRLLANPLPIVLKRGDELLPDGVLRIETPVQIPGCDRAPYCRKTDS